MRTPFPKAHINIGSMRNQCGACGQCFGGVTGFDMHRVGDFEKGTRRCLSPEEFGTKWGHRMTLVAGFWQQADPSDRVRAAKVAEVT